MVARNLISNNCLVFQELLLRAIPGCGSGVTFSLTLLYERKRKAARCSRVKSNVKRKMKDVRNTVLDQDSILFRARANDGEEGRR